MKSEAQRSQSFKKCPLAFIDKNHLGAAWFKFTNQSDIVRCTICGVEIGYWQQGNDAFKDHQRWSLSCEFVRGLFVGNIATGSSEQPTASSE